MARDEPESRTLLQRLKGSVYPPTMIFALVAYQAKSIEPGQQPVGVNLIKALWDEASCPKEGFHSFTKVPSDEQINGSHALGPHREVACLFFRQFAGEIILIGIGAVQNSIWLGEPYFSHFANLAQRGSIESLCVVSVLKCRRQEHFNAFPGEQRKNLSVFGIEQQTFKVLPKIITMGIP